jgi:hypothetical protein
MYNGYAEEEEGAQKRRKTRNTIKERRIDRRGDGKDGRGGLREWVKKKRREREVSKKVNTK